MYSPDLLSIPSVTVVLRDVSGDRHASRGAYISRTDNSVKVGLTSDLNSKPYQLFPACLLLNELKYETATSLCWWTQPVFSCVSAPKRSREMMKSMSWIVHFLYRGSCVLPRNHCNIGLSNPDFLPTMFILFVLLKFYMCLLSKIFVNLLQHWSMIDYFSLTLLMVSLQI